MTDSEFKRELETLNDSFNRVRRIAAEWHAFIAGRTNSRPTVTLAYLFRPGSIVVKDSVALVGKVLTGKEAKDRIKSIYALIKPCVECLDEFITVPTVKSSCAVEDVKGLFELLHARLLEEMPDSPGKDGLDIPQNTGDHRVYKIEIKKLAHRLAQELISSPKFPLICKNPQARDYIVNCSRGKIYFKECKVIQDAMEAYGWSLASLLTFCKGGSTYDKKTNDKRQTKISKKKRRIRRDLKGAWHDAVP